MGQRQQARASRWGLAGWLVAIALAAGIAAWVVGRNWMPPMLAGTAGRRTPARHEPRAAPEAPGGMSREQLEAEVSRLRGQVRDKDRQIDELTIQLKLATAGSRTQEPKDR